MGLPVRNGIPHLKEALDALLAQTFGDFEIVISDNASDDGTQDLCEDYAKRDARIRYFRNEENIGLIKNYNRVFDLSQATYFKWVAHDDLHEPRYLEACLPPIQSDALVSVSHCNTVLVDDAGRPLPYDAALNSCYDAVNDCRWYLDDPRCATRGTPSRRFRDVLAGQIMCGPVYGLMRKEFLTHTGLNQAFFGSDKLLLAELALIGRFHIVPENLFKKRMHPKMTSVMKGTKQKFHIDPRNAVQSPQVQKLFAYLARLGQHKLRPADRASCYYHLAVHSALSVFPLDWRYRPQLLKPGLPGRSQKRTT
jgi:glycosyltransferase involved in cell wall biosynthesis